MGIKCGYCNYQTNRSHNLRLHRGMYHQGVLQNFPCDKCPYETVSKWYLRNHTKRWHKDSSKKPYRYITPKDELPEHKFFFNDTSTKPHLLIEGNCQNPK